MPHSCAIRLTRGESGGSNRIYTGVRAAGFGDVRAAHVTLFRWPGPDGRRPSEVAADVRISKQRVNDLLRDLERLGYLCLARDPGDSRARIIHLTERGRRLHEVAVAVHAQIEDEWRHRIGPRRYEDLRAALAELMGPRGAARTQRWAGPIAAIVCELLSSGARKTYGGPPAARLLGQRSPSFWLTPHGAARAAELAPWAARTFNCGPAS